MWPLLGQTRKLDQFCDYRGLLYPLPIPLTGRLQQTHSVRFHAKFYLNRYIVSPLRSENPIFYYIFNFSGDKVERRCTTTNHLLSNGTKTVSIFQCVDDEVVHALYVIQKRDGQKKTENVSREPSRCNTGSMISFTLPRNWYTLPCQIRSVYTVATVGRKKPKTRRKPRF